MKRTARYGSRCRACGASYGVGAEIFSVGSGWFCSRACAEAGPLRVTAADVAARAGASSFGRGSRAPCPSHGSKGLTLSIAEGDNGGVVLKCFAGCDAASVAAALGFEMHNFAPRDSDAPRILSEARRPPSAAEVRDALRNEAQTYRARHRLSDGERFVYADIVAIRHTVAAKLGVSLPAVARRVSDSFAGGHERDWLWPLLLERGWRETWIITTGSPPLFPVDEFARLGKAGIAALIAAERRAAIDVRMMVTTSVGRRQVA